MLLVKCKFASYLAMYVFLICRLNFKNDIISFYQFALTKESHDHCWT